MAHLEMSVLQRENLLLIVILSTEMAMIALQVILVRDPGWKTYWILEHISCRIMASGLFLSIVVYNL